MNKLHLIFTGIFLFCVWTNLFSQDKLQNSDTLKLLVSTAKESKRELFMVFGWEGCGWCRRLEKYHNDPQVKSILNKYLMISNIDIYKTDKTKDLYKRFGKEGTPSWTIFDFQGKIVVDSDLGKGNIGYPATEEELNFYIMAMRKVIPKLSKADSNLLIDKLIEYRTQKE